MVISDGQAIVHPQIRNGAQRYNARLTCAKLRPQTPNLLAGLAQLCSPLVQLRQSCHIGIIQRSVSAEERIGV